MALGAIRTYPADVVAESDLGDDALAGVEGLESPTILARSASAVVFSALQPSLDRKVAVKVSCRRVKNGISDWDFGAYTEHPNVVQVYRSGQTATGRPYVVMPLLTASLRDRLNREGPLPWLDVARIGIQLAGALETIHLSGRVHGDVCLSNILCSGYGEPILVGQKADLNARLSPRNATARISAEVAELVGVLRLLGTGEGQQAEHGVPTAAGPRVAEPVLGSSTSPMRALALAAQLQSYQGAQDSGLTHPVITAAEGPVRSPAPIPSRSTRRPRIILAASVGALVPLVFVAALRWTGDHPATALSAKAAALMDPAAKHCADAPMSAPAGDGVAILTPGADTVIADEIDVEGTAHLASDERLYFFVYAPGICLYYFTPHPITVDAAGSWAVRRILRELRGSTTSMTAARVPGDAAALLDEIIRFSASPDGEAPFVATFPPGSVTATVRVTVRPSS